MLDNLASVCASEIALLRNSLVLSKSEADEPESSLYVNLAPPTTNITCHSSSLSGL